MPRIRLQRFQQLSATQLTAWHDLQQSNYAFESAFFHPGFARVVDSVRSDVEVAVLEQDGCPVGFFPFQRNRRNIGAPVGGRLSEFHGVIVAEGTSWNAEELVRAGRLRAWYFDHLIGEQPQFDRFRWREEKSPYMDLTGGFDAYLERRSRDGVSTYKQTLRKQRKIEREIGELRFEFHTNCEAARRSLIQWKTEQYRRTNRIAMFRYDWTRKLIDAAQHAEYDGFRGVCSALYVANQLAAVHLGLCSRNVLHIWFPAYGAEFEKYSPGMILLVELARECARRGLRKIDFGKGPERYKASFKTGDVAICGGVVENRTLMKLLRPQWYAVKHWMRRSPLRRPLEASIRTMNRFKDWLSLRSA